MLVSSVQNKFKYNAFEARANSKKLQAKPAYSQVNFSGDNLDDGKIGFKNASKHFLKGIASPFAMLFSSVKNFVLGVGIIAGGALLCSAFPPLLPVMVATGIITGGVQMLKGAYNSVSAETDKQKEKAFEDMGSGTFAVVSSAIGAKGSLKAAGVENTDNLNILRATYRCFREIPVGFSKSAKMARNGTAIVNFKNTFNAKRVDVSDADDIALLKEAGYKPEKLAEIKKYSQILHDDAVDCIYSTVNPNRPYHPLKNPYSKDSYITQVLELFPEEIRGKFKFRAKSASSIKDRLIRAMVNKNKAINSLDDAKASVQDLIGCRLVLDDANELRLNTVVNSISDAIIDGKFEFGAIENYSGKGIKPYFSEFDIDKLRESKAMFSLASGKQRQNIQASIVKNSGYTTAQIDMKYQNGLLGELQIRGNKINKLANVEHIPYNIRRGKDISCNNPVLAKLFSKTKTNISALNKRGYNAYIKYLNDSYKYYRNMELGLAGGTKPALANYMKGNPSMFLSAENTSNSKNVIASIFKTLDIDSLESLKVQSEWLERIPNTRFIELIREQALVYPAIQNLVAKNSNE